jgi:hypothetical protein
LATQAFVLAHAPQPLVPPQSASVSPWFFTPSEQVGALQTCGVAVRSQTALEQSAALPHLSPVPQSLPSVAQTAPQSTSLSPWFFT